MPMIRILAMSLETVQITFSTVSKGVTLSENPSTAHVTAASNIEEAAFYISPGSNIAAVIVNPISNRKSILMFYLVSPVIGVAPGCVPDTCSTCI